MIKKCLKSHERNEGDEYPLKQKKTVRQESSGMGVGRKKKQEKERSNDGGACERT